MVRDAVDFFRGVWWLVLDEAFFWPVDADGELFFFFFVDEEELLCALLGADEVVWAGNPLPCSSKSPARIVAVNRLTNIAGFSLTRSNVLPHTALVVNFGTFGGIRNTLPGRNPSLSITPRIHLYNGEEPKIAGTLNS